MKTDGPFRILFLCTGNSCRSQMAEGWARRLLDNRVEVRSAGSKPTAVNPKAVEVMAEVGVDISSHRSKSLDELQDQSFDLVITLCDSARASCPISPGGGKRIHNGFPDPAEAEGSDEEVLEVFREARDRIRVELIPLLKKELEGGSV